jgi:hypothetical protein
LGYQLPFSGRVATQANSSPPICAPSPLVDIPTIVGIVEMNLGVVIIDIVLDSIGTLVPPVTTMPKVLQVVNMGP